MAKSSIFARVRINNQHDAEAFFHALELSAEATKDEVIKPSYKFVTDPQEIRDAVEGWRRNHRRV